MKRFTWIVLTNCPPGREREFNDWYDNVHIPDLLRIPGVISARRYELSGFQMSLVADELIHSDPQGINARFRFLACYDIETDDVYEVLEKVRKRSGTREMQLSDDLVEVYTLMYEALP